MSLAEATRRSPSLARMLTLDPGRERRRRNSPAPAERDAGNISRQDVRVELASAEPQSLRGLADREQVRIDRWSKHHRPGLPACRALCLPCGSLERSGSTLQRESEQLKVCL